MCICRTKRLMKSKCVLHPEQPTLTLYWRFMRTFGWQCLFAIQWMVERLSLLMLSSTGRRPQTLMELYKHIFDNLNSNETQDVFEQWTSAVERTGMSTFSNICMSLDKDGRWHKMGIWTHIDLDSDYIRRDNNYLGYYLGEFWIWQSFWINEIWSTTRWKL